MRWLACALMIAGCGPAIVHRPDGSVWYRDTQGENARDERAKGAVLGFTGGVILTTILTRRKP